MSNELVSRNLIRQCAEQDFQAVLTIINRGAEAYRGRIPAERWHAPYMPAEELKEEVASGVVFFGFEENGRLIGVMGVQELGEVTLIRHAYVLPERQQQGIGGKLLNHLLGLAKSKRILVGTWEANDWAVNFYAKHGFKLQSKQESRRLLKQYWVIPDSQIEASIVLEKQT